MQPTDPSTDPWRDADFRRLWIGETVSLLGSQVTTLALPLAAILALDAGPAQLGLLGAASFVPFLLFGLPAGTWIDRRERRPVLVAANLGRAVLVGIVPLAALVGALTFELLLAVAFLVGTLTVAFEVGYLAYIPRLIERSRLVAANARLFASASAAEVAGPGLAGLLIGAIGAPFALAVDAVSYLVSAGSLATIRRREAPPVPSAERRHFLRELREGAASVVRHPIVRPLAAEAATFNVFAHALAGVFLLHATRNLGLDAPTIGAVFSIGSVGSLVGTVAAAPIARRFGLGRALVATMVLACSAPLAIPLIGGPPLAAAAALAAVYAVEGFGISVTVVHVVSLRQAVTPDRLLARMQATYRTVSYGMIPLGSLLGGFLGEVVGLRGALVVAVVGIALAPVWVLASPIRAIRSIADVPEDEPPPEPARVAAAVEAIRVLP